MERLKKDLNWFVQQKCYVATLILTGICAYGYEITHTSVGIDDTAMPLYLSDGLEVILGRWTMFLLEKLFRFAEFTPFLLELVEAFGLMLSAMLFSVLLRRILGDRVGIGGYMVFSCLFLSNPIISEIYIYYFHNGISLGYSLTALALMAFLDGMENTGKKRLGNFVCGALFMWTAIGCYESFIIVYILGIFVILFLRGMSDREQLKTIPIIKYLCIGALVCAVSMVLRELSLSLLKVIFRLGDLEEKELLAKYSISTMLELFESKEGIQNLIMFLKRFWLVYHVNAIVYLPVAVYEVAIWTFGIASLYLAVKKKNIWYPILFAGMYISPTLLIIVDKRVTPYRASQYLPFFAALGCMFLFCGICKISKEKHYGKYLGCVLAAILIWNQTYAINKNFYTDWLQYEHTKDVLFQVAYEIQQEYGSDIPVFFTGNYDDPHSLLEEYYVSYDSVQYRLIKSITSVVDPHLSEKYHSPYGYSFIGEAGYSFIQWSLDAFGSTDREMHAFLRMHGYEFLLVTDIDMIEEAKDIAENLPGFPQKGSIVKQQNYIIVNF